MRTDFQWLLYVEASALLFKSDADEEPKYVLVTEHRVETGDDWIHTGLQTSHEWNWSGYPIRSPVDVLESNTQRTDTAPLFALTVEQERMAVEWTLSNASLDRGHGSTSSPPASRTRP